MLLLLSMAKPHYRLKLTNKWVTYVRLSFPVKVRREGPKRIRWTLASPAGLTKRFIPLAETKTKPERFSVHFGQGQVDQVMCFLPGSNATLLVRHEARMWNTENILNREGLTCNVACDVGAGGAPFVQLPQKPKSGFRKLDIRSVPFGDMGAKQAGGIKLVSPLCELITTSQIVELILLVDPFEDSRTWIWKPGCR